MQCYTCFGQRNVTCPTCHGKGSYFKVLGKKNVFEICYQCGGRRTVSCQTCGGTGVVPDPALPIAVPMTGTLIDPPPPPHALAPDPALLQLDGQWKGHTGWRYEFVKANDGYHVTELNFLGMKMGEGEAAANGKVLTLTLRNKITGKTTIDLQLHDGRLTGTTRGLIPLPFALSRA